MCKFSIIVPCYEIENNVVALFDMLSIRKYSDYEVIFVDDCSKDKTFEVLCKTQSLKEEYKNFRCLQTAQNGGPGIARNLGLKHATGEFVIFCDSDDEFDVTALNKIESFLDSHSDADMIVFPHCVIKNNVKKIEDKYFSYHSEDKVQKNDVALGNLAPWSKVFKNDLIKKYNIEFPKRMTGEDICFNIDYVSKANIIYKFDLVFYGYVMQANSISHKKDIKFPDRTTFEVLETIYEKEFPELLIEKFAATHLLTKAKHMYMSSCTNKEMKEWFKAQNKKYPKWIKRLYVKKQGLYRRIIFFAIYFNSPILVKTILWLKEKIYYNFR